MVLGEELHSGGKALESNILEKRPSFIKTLSEFVQLRGQRSITSGAVQASASDTFFTVPSNQILFIFSVSLHQTTSGVGNARCSFQIDSGIVMSMHVIATGAENQIMNFSPPLIVKGNENLIITKNNTNTSHIARANVTGYLLDKETAIESI